MPIFIVVCVWSCSQATLPRAKRISYIKYESRMASRAKRISYIKYESIMRFGGLTVEEGQLPQAPPRTSSTDRFSGSILWTATLPPSEIKYGWTSSRTLFTFWTVNSMLPPELKLICFCSTTWGSKGLEMIAEGSTSLFFVSSASFLARSIAALRLWKCCG